MSLKEFKLPLVDFIEKEVKADLTYNNVGLELMGKLPLSDSLSIDSSPIGIGFETLDRKTFDPKPTYKFLAKSGVKWARVQTGWNRCEKNKGKYTFKWLDDIVDNLLEIGIQPWFSMCFGNKHYTRTNDHLQEYVGEVPLYYGPNAINGWKKYVSALAKYFKGRVTHWEVWNEPNAGFWRPKPNAKDYVEFVKITSQEVKKFVQDAIIIAGALSPSGAYPFATALSKAGLSKHMDIFSFHAHGICPEWHIEKQLGLLRKLFPGIPIWQGEAGRPSSSKNRLIGGKKGFNLNETSQAKYLLRRILTDLYYGYAMTSYFTASDYKDYMKKGNEHHQGVLTTKPCKPKESFFTLQAVCSLFDSRTSRTNYFAGVYPTKNTLMSYIRYIAAKVYTFERENIPVMTWYLPENPDIESEPFLIELQIVIPEEKKMKYPIVIDPLLQRVYRVKDVMFCPEGRIRIFNVPIMDYPLIISDEKILKTINRN